jgi:phage gp36-like protein
MAYITNDEFEQAFGEEESNGLLREGNDFNKAAGAASSLIDGYIAGRYGLPLTSVPDLLKAWALDITRYRLWDEQAPEEVRRRYEDVLAQLKLLSEGKISLPISDIQPTADTFVSDGFSRCRVFTDETLRGF